MMTRHAHAQSKVELVESNVADTGPLSRSLRDLSIDLRMPTGFDKLYHIQGDREYYMRSSGGLHAVFPRSVYSRSRSRRGNVTRTKIPDGTVFYIGTPPMFEESSRKPEPQERSRAEDYRASDTVSIRLGVTNSGAGTSRLHPTRRRSSTPRQTTICTDTNYRSTRLHMLMRQAAKTAKQAG
ncbi:MAG: hypothetical protein O7G85_14630 [Planctomycetota bacterium]|nr:hypothetical protein [Planctomycetota bacterium]